MKDSRVGSYGVVAMWLALSGKFVLLLNMDAALLPVVLLTGHAVSRFCSTVLLATLDYVRELAGKAKPLATELSLGEMLVALAFTLPGLAMLPLFKALSGVLLAALAGRLAGPQIQALARRLYRRLSGRHPTGQRNCLLPPASWRLCRNDPASDPSSEAAGRSRISTWSTRNSGQK